MALISILQQSSALGGFYVPRFEVKIAGAGLPRDVLRDVTELTYKDDVKEIDGFELTVANWDSETREFKYVGAEESATPDPTTPAGQRQTLFDPCNKQVEISLGYGGELGLMMKGSFTTLEPNFPSTGPSTMAVRGLNVLHQLRRKQYTHAWVSQKDSDIAENIATLTDPATGQRRFPLPIVTDPDAKRDEHQIPYVAQRNQYDIDFLFRRARERGYVVVVLPGDPNAAGAAREQRLYFGPSQGASAPAVGTDEHILEWGKALVDFKPTLTTANQIRSVTVNGWNRSTRRPIRETVTLDDRRVNLNPDLRATLQNCDPREEQVVDEPVFTAAQARARAIAILTDRQRQYVKATGTCIGLPGLRAGGHVRIRKLGARFSGKYFLDSTTHTLNERGYMVKFQAHREGPDEPEPGAAP